MLIDFSSQEQHQSVSSDSESNGESIEDLLSKSNEDEISSSHQQPDQHQNQRWHEVHSDIFGTLSDYIKACVEAPLRAVARFVLERGAVRLQDATKRYEAAGGRVYTHATRFLEHLLRHLPLSAFSGARKLGWMLFERTEHYSVCVKMLQHIRNLEDQQRTFKSMSKEEYHDLERMMTAEERMLARYLLMRLCGAAETRARFGITNGDATVNKVNDARACFDAADGGCETTVRKNSRIAIKLPKKGGRRSWVQKKHIADAFVKEVQQTVVFLNQIFFLLKRVYANIVFVFATFPLKKELSSLVQGGKIDPSLNDGYLFATNTSLDAIRNRLLEKEPLRKDVPSKSALSRGAETLGVKFKVTRKVHL